MKSELPLLSATCNFNDALTVISLKNKKQPWPPAALLCFQQLLAAMLLTSPRAALTSDLPKRFLCSSAEKSPEELASAV